MTDKLTDHAKGQGQWIFGLHAVQAVLKTSANKVRLLKVLRGREDQRLQKILAMAERQGLSVERVMRSDLDDLADGSHQGVAALCDDAEVQDEHFLYELLDRSEETPFLLILDGITDPHNLGACLRSADAAGVQAVIVPKDNSVGLTPVVQKVASGAAENVPLVVVTNLARTLRKLQARGLWIIGAAGEAEQLVYNTDLKGPVALVMGAEGKGLRRLTREYCDLLVKLPMVGVVSSLNVSVATGICLFEAVRQRR